MNLIFNKIIDCVRFNIDFFKKNTIIDDYLMIYIGIFYTQMPFINFLISLLFYLISCNNKYSIVLLALQYISYKYEYINIYITFTYVSVYFFQDIILKSGKTAYDMVIRQNIYAYILSRYRYNKKIDWDHVMWYKKQSLVTLSPILYTILKTKYPKIDSLNRVFELLQPVYLKVVMIFWIAILRSDIIQYLIYAAIISNFKLRYDAIVNRKITVL